MEKREETHKRGKGQQWIQMQYQAWHNNWIIFLWVSTVTEDIREVVRIGRGEARSA